jgi:hypothetical protein
MSAERAAWRRTPADDGWEMTDDTGTYRLVTDRSVVLFGKCTTEAMIAAYDLPPLPS